MTTNPSQVQLTTNQSSNQLIRPIAINKSQDIIANADMINLSLMPSLMADKKVKSYLKEFTRLENKSHQRNFRYDSYDKSTDSNEYCTIQQQTPIFAAVGGGGSDV